MSYENPEAWDIEGRTALTCRVIHGLVDVIQDLPQEESYIELFESLNEWSEQRIEDNKWLLKEVFYKDG